MFSFIDLPRLAEFCQVCYLFFYCSFFPSLFFFLVLSVHFDFLFFFVSFIIWFGTIVLSWWPQTGFFKKIYFAALFFKLLLARIHLLFSHYSFSPFIQTGLFNRNFPLFFHPDFTIYSTSCCQFLWFLINESFFYFFYWSIFILSGIFSLFIFYIPLKILYLFYCPPGTY